MATSRFPSDCVSGPCDGTADRSPIPGEASLRSCIPPLRDFEVDEFEMVGTGPAMMRLRMQVERIGPHFRAVVVSGEAGTGKELAARALHRLSPGAGGPFIVFRAGESSAESFDMKRVAASSADIDRAVKMAQSGTLFLDGISEMQIEVQAHLLRLLRRQDGSQAGLAVSQKMNLRMIASTREDLRVMASTGRFLQELYQRLAMVEIALPPLRERREDIPQLAIFLVERLMSRLGKNIEEIAGDAMKRLEAHVWPGNVRELESALRHGVLECEGTVLEAGDLPAFVVASTAESAAGALGTLRLQDVVEQHVLRVLKNCAGNKLRAAELLGISRSTLYRMLEAHSYSDGAAMHGRAASEERYTR
jgi:DNA-binding NtrC family response regulator